MLVNYNGTAITYDNIGNPLNWRNASEFVWSARELVSANLTNGNTVSYTYNADGIRTQKVYNNTVHNYILDGSKIIKEEVSVNGNTSYELYYIYDASGSIIGFQHNNNPYYFLKNLQGDVVSIVDAVGEVVVEYTYDAWGKLLTTTGTMASTVGTYNPFRYRGYYYDTETGFYYLRSRYYDPTVGRFLNADSIVGANGDIVGYNMFAYCSNNPIIGYDPSGHKYERREALEERILFLHDCYWAKDNFGFVGDIKVGFDKVGRQTVTAEWFIRAMINVDFQATPALKKRFEQLMTIDKYAQYARSYAGTVSAGMEFQILNLTYQAAVVADQDELAVLQTVGVSSSAAVGVSVNSTVSAAKDVSSLKGFAVACERGACIYIDPNTSVSVRMNHSTGIGTNGVVTATGSLFIGWAQEVPETVCITWTW